MLTLTTGYTHHTVHQFFLCFLPPEPALVIVHPDDVVIPAGDSVLLTCIGYGMPVPSISWQKNGENLTDSSLKFTVTETNVFVEDTVFVKSVLLLCNVSDLDSGNYTCIADNTIQRPSTETFSVRVQCKFALIIVV